MTILEANQLNKRYPGTLERAVNDFSLQMRSGEIVALLGESGCGKTTVLRMIAGFEVPDSGELSINGERFVGKNTFVEPEKRGVGLVFQDNALFPHKTVAQNIGFGLYKLKRAEADKKLADLIHLTGLQGYEHRFPHQLSGGQQQRVALARALAPDPKLILFDEPFSSIDTLLKIKLREDISKILRNTGTTSIFVTHDTKDAMAIADHVIILRNGLTIQQGTPEEVYKFPNNRYVAEFFGKANIIKVSTNKDFYNSFLKMPELSKESDVLLCIRPNAIAVESTSNNQNIACRILGEQFLGEYKELVCSVRIDGIEIELITYCHPNQAFPDGICYLNIDKHAIQQMRE